MNRKKKEQTKKKEIFNRLKIGLLHNILSVSKQTKKKSLEKKTRQKFIVVTAHRKSTYTFTHTRVPVPLFAIKKIAR